MSAAATIAPVWAPTGTDTLRIEQVLARLGWVVLTTEEARQLTVCEIAVHAPVELSARQSHFLAALRRRWARMREQ